MKNVENALVFNNNFKHIGVIDSKGITHHFDRDSKIHTTGISNGIKIPLNELDTFGGVFITPAIIDEADLRWSGTEYEDGKLTKKGLNNCYGYVAHVLTIAMGRKITQNDIDGATTRWLRVNRSNLYDKLMKEQDPSYVPKADRQKSKRETMRDREEDQDGLIRNFMKLTGVDEAKAIEIISESNGNIQVALDKYYSTNAPELEPEPEPEPGPDDDLQLQEEIQLIEVIKQSEKREHENVKQLAESYNVSRDVAEAVLAAHDGNMSEASEFLFNRARSAALKPSKKKYKRRKSKRKSKRRSSKRKKSKRRKSKRRSSKKKLN